MGNFKAVYRVLSALKKAMDPPGFDVQQIGHEALGATHEALGATHEALGATHGALGATHEALVPVHGDDGRRWVHQRRRDSAVHHRRDLGGRAGYSDHAQRLGVPAGKRHHGVAHRLLLPVRPLL